MNEIKNKLTDDKFKSIYFKLLQNIKDIGKKNAFITALYAVDESIVNKTLSDIGIVEFSVDNECKKLNLSDVKKYLTKIEEENKHSKKNMQNLIKKFYEQQVSEANKNINNTASVTENNANANKTINALAEVKISEGRSVGAGADGEQIYEQGKPNTATITRTENRKRKSFDDIFGSKRDNIAEIKKILENPSASTNWVTFNSIDTNGDTLLTWSLSKKPDEFTKFAASLVLNDINNTININHKNGKGQNALDIAIENKHFSQKNTRTTTPIIKHLLEKGAHMEDKQQKDVLVQKKLYTEESKDCTDYILDKTILHSTSGYGGFSVCELKDSKMEPEYIQTFLDYCVKYFGDNNNIKKMIHEKYGLNDTSLLGAIQDKTKKLKSVAQANDEEEKSNNVMMLRCELQSLLTTYDLLQQRLTDKITAKDLVAYIFTSWIKFIFPIGSSEKSIDKAYQLIADLLTEMHKSMIDKNIFGCLHINQNKKRFLLNIDPLKLLIFSMIFHLVPPNEALVFKVSMLKSYNILSFYKRDIRIENQNIIMALIHDFNIASIESFFKDVYRVPVDIPTGKTEIDNDFTGIDRWKNMEAGIETIISIMKAPTTNLKKYETLDVIPETAPIRKKLAETDEARAFFIYAPTKDMFKKELNSLKFYTLYDILCNQYFQEYKEIIDKEHLITSAKLRYLCNYGVTTKKDKEFDLIIAIIEFALVSYFVQNQLTGECNRAAGTKPRWSQSVEQYRRILTFICKLYLSKTRNETIYMTINGNKGTTNDYIDRMNGSSNIINKSEGFDNEIYEYMKKKSLKTIDDFKTDFIRKPTIILPNKAKNELMLDRINKKPPLINYGFDISVLEIERIGERMNALLGESSIPEIINEMFNNSSQIIDYLKIQDLISKRVDSMYKYEDVASKKLPMKNNFGSDPGDEKLSEEALLLLQLPSFDTMDKRIDKMIKLIEKIEKEHPKDDVFEKVISFRKSIILSDNNNNGRKELVQYKPSQSVTVSKPIGGKSPTKKSFLSKLFSTKKVEPT